MVTEKKQSPTASVTEEQGTGTPAPAGGEPSSVEPGSVSAPAPKGAKSQKKWTSQQLNQIAVSQTYRENKKGGRTITVEKDWGDGEFSVRDVLPNEDGTANEWVAQAEDIAEHYVRIIK